MKTLRALALSLLVSYCLSAQNAALMPVPKMQFFSSLGKPLAGGLVYTYAAGTATPLATYTDSTATTPNANPVVLDSGGFASIWLGSSAYKITLQSATGVTQWTQDNVSNSGFALSGSLSGASGATLINYIGSGTGAVARSVASKLGDIVSVKDFGATGNGTTDDTAAIQAAITAQAGKLLFVPDGNYKITSTLTMNLTGTDGRGTSLECESPRAVLRYSGSGAALFIYGTGASNPALTVRNCIVDGTSSATGSIGLHLQAFTAGHFDNFRVQNFKGDGLFNEGGIALTFLDCQFNNNGGNGVHNVGIVVGGQNYAANANKFIGGQIAYNAAWGVFEDGALAGSVGPNQNNVYLGMTFEINGTNGVQNSGMVYFQLCDVCALENSYLEYVPGNTEPNNIVLGGTTSDGIMNRAGSPNSPIISNNILFSQTSMSSVRAINSRGMVITGNSEEGTPASFVNLGTGLNVIGRIWGNQSLSASATFTGTDSGDIMTDQTGLINSVTPVPFQWGVGFHAITGSDQDLVVRTHRGGTNTVNFMSLSGGTYGSISDAGKISLPSAEFANSLTVDNRLVMNALGVHVFTASIDTDIQFHVTFGSGASSATYTFATAYNNAPRCLATPLQSMGSGGSANTWWITTTSTTATVNTAVAATGAAFSVFCLGSAN